MIASEQSRYNIDIAALSDSRLADAGLLNEMANGYTFFWKELPANARRIHGLGLTIRTELVQTPPESPVAISERLMTLRIPLAKHRHATFISAYAPTLPSDDETKDHYYVMLRSILMQIPRSDKFIVLGNFNGRTGSDFTIWGNVMGKQHVGNINSNGHRLLSLCSEFGLFVTNTLFQLKHIHRTTWMHIKQHRSKQWHLLDYVLVKAVDIQDVQITRVMRGAECGQITVLSALRSAYALVPQPENRNLSFGSTSAA